MAEIKQYDVVRVVNHRYKTTPLDDDLTGHCLYVWRIEGGKWARLNNLPHWHPLRTWDGYNAGASQLLVDLVYVEPPPPMQGVYEIENFGRYRVAIMQSNPYDDMNPRVLFGDVILRTFGHDHLAEAKDVARALDASGYSPDEIVALRKLLGQYEGGE